MMRTGIVAAHGALGDVIRWLQTNEPKTARYIVQDQHGFIMALEEMNRYDLAMQPATLNNYTMSTQQLPNRPDTIRYLLRTMYRIFLVHEIARIDHVIYGDES